MDDACYESSTSPTTPAAARYSTGTFDRAGDKAVTAVDLREGLRFGTGRHLLTLATFTLKQLFKGLAEELLKPVRDWQALERIIAIRANLVRSRVLDSFVERQQRHKQDQIICLGFA